MKIQEFNREIARREGNSKQVNISQISEISKVINDLMGGIFYKLIKHDLYNNKAFIGVVKLILVLCFRKAK